MRSDVVSFPSAGVVVYLQRRTSLGWFGLGVDRFHNSLINNKFPWTGALDSARVPSQTPSEEKRRCSLPELVTR